MAAYIASQYKKAFEVGLFYSIVGLLIGYLNHLKYSNNFN
jgi:hypothetical protein